MNLLTEVVQTVVQTVEVVQMVVVIYVYIYYMSGCLCYPESLTGLFAFIKILRSL